MNRHGLPVRGLITACAFLSGCHLWKSVDHSPSADVVNDVYLLRHDVGVFILAPGQYATAEHSFVIANPAEVGMRLQVARKSCGCAHLEFDEGEVSPNSDAVVRLTYELAPVTAVRREFVEFRTNLVDFPVVRLELEAKSYSSVAFDQPGPILVSAAQADDVSVDVTIVVHELTSDVMTPVTFTVDGGAVGVSQIGVGATYESDGVRTRTIPVSVVVPSRTKREPQAGGIGTAGRNISNLVLVVGHRDQEARLRVVVEHSGCISVTPQRLFISQASDAARSASLRMQRDQPFRIVDVATTVEDLLCDVTLDREAHEHVVEVRLQRRAADEPLASHGVLIITTDCEREPKVIVPAYVFNPLRGSAAN